MAAFVLAIMAHRNTPDPITGLSPAEVLYGRTLRDAFKFASDADRNSRANMSPTWREAWELKERANRHRFYCQRQATNAHARDVKELAVGSRVFVQNQHGGAGAKEHRWDRSGKVLERLRHNAYLIKLDGSGRVSRRTRQHLRPFVAPDKSDGRAGAVDRRRFMPVQDLRRNHDIGDSGGVEACDQQHSALQPTIGRGGDGVQPGSGPGIAGRNLGPPPLPPAGPIDDEPHTDSGVPPPGGVEPSGGDGYGYAAAGRAEGHVDVHDTPDNAGNRETGHAAPTEGLRRNSMPGDGAAERRRGRPR